MDVVAEQPREQAGDVHDRVVEVEEARFEQLLPAERQQLTRDGTGPLRSLANLLDVGPRRMARRHFAERELGVAGNRGQRVVEIVRDPASQPADRLHFLRLPQLILELPSIGDVLHRADHARRPA